MVGVGRQSLADPLFAKKMLAGELKAVNYCTICDRCLELMFAQKVVGCAVYDKYYRDLYRSLKKESRAK